MLQYIKSNIFYWYELVHFNTITKRRDGGYEIVEHFYYWDHWESYAQT